MYTYSLEAQIPITLSPGFAQIQAIVDQMPEEDKLRLASYLDPMTIVKLIERFQVSAAKFPLYNEEIQAAVKAVRREQHALSGR